MTILVQRLNGSTFQCVSGHMRLRASLDVSGKASVTDMETQETFDVHEVDGQMVVLDNGNKDRASTLAEQAIDHARQC